jgi:hypothetical protein
MVIVADRRAAGGGAKDTVRRSSSMSDRFRSSFDRLWDVFNTTSGSDSAEAKRRTSRQSQRSSTSDQDNGPTLTDAIKSPSCRAALLKVAQEHSCQLQFR